MSKEFVDAIVQSDNINAETIFKAQMGIKVGDALEVKRKEYSNTFVKTKEETDEV